MSPFELVDKTVAQPSKKNPAELPIADAYCSARVYEGVRIEKDATKIQDHKARIIAALAKNPAGASLKGKAQRPRG